MHSYECVHIVYLIIPRGANIISYAVSFVSTSSVCSYRLWSLCSVSWSFRRWQEGEAERSGMRLLTVTGSASFSSSDKGGPRVQSISLFVWYFVELDIRQQVRMKPLVSFKKIAISKSAKGGHLLC